MFAVSGKIKFHGRAMLGILALILAGGVSAQQLQSLKLNSVVIRVSNIEQSLRFYQDLVGLTEVGTNGGAHILRIDEGPQFLAIAPVAAGEAPHIAQIGLRADGFKAEDFAAYLTAQGYSQREHAPPSVSPDLNLAKSFWLQKNVVNFVDPEGTPFQVSDNAYCGAENACKQSASQAGKLHLLGINHFTTFVSNAPRANQYFQDLMKLGIQSYQGPTTPALAVGDGKQFLMFVGGAQEGPPQNPSRIHHVSFSMENFDVDGIFATLKSYGLTPRADGVANAPPLTYYVSLRMPNRGGAEGGTPEVYFTDPDGILLQVQDPSYCGGGGYLGDKC